MKKKTASITLASMILISGLMICGAEAPSLFYQFLCSVIGIGLLWGGGRWLLSIKREDDHANRNL